MTDMNTPDSEVFSNRLSKVNESLSDLIETGRAHLREAHDTFKNAVVQHEITRIIDDLEGQLGTIRDAELAAEARITKDAKARFDNATVPVAGRDDEPKLARLQSLLLDSTKKREERDRLLLAFANEGDPSLAQLAQASTIPASRMLFTPEAIIKARALYVRATNATLVNKLTAAEEYVGTLIFNIATTTKQVGSGTESSVWQQMGAGLANRKTVILQPLVERRRELADMLVELPELRSSNVEIEMLLSKL